MEEEMNYLSEKIEDLENAEPYEMIDLNEISLLKNILVYITSYELKEDTDE